jgi:DNA-binding NarL/FixJ family response regulator
MATVIVVEPNALLRLGILQLLQKMTFDLEGEGIDYAQLFQGVPSQQSMDLMLLSVPDVYDRMVELVNAAQQGYTPRRILLLSDTPTLPYSLLNLPPILAGYISKYSSPDVLTAAITLVLAGGKCFPSPDMVSNHAGPREGEPHHVDGATPRRRWYEKGLPPPKPSNDDAQPANLLTSAERRQARTPDHALAVPFEAGEPQPLSPALIASEAEMLSLTPRQYEVLALLARGYPIKSVSRELNISVATTKAHTETLYQRLSVHNRNAAVYAAFSRGATLGWRKADLAGKPMKQQRS